MLSVLLHEFDVWAATANRDDAGWQNDFPKWRELIGLANACLTAPDVSEEQLHLVGRCWAASEEDEECARFARSHINEPVTLQAVSALTKDPNRDTRWQAYDVVGGYSGENAPLYALLEVGLVDEDSYVRRRAFNVLLKNSSAPRRVHYISAMLADTEEYNRYVAVKAALKMDESKIKEQAHSLLERDHIVRELLEYYFEHKNTIDKFNT